MKRILLLPAMLLLMSTMAYNQSVGVGTTTPHASAQLEVSSANKGMLVPRIALTAANKATPVTNPADALLVYNTSTAGTGVDAVTPGFYYWNQGAGRWTSISAATGSNNTAGFGGWGDCDVQNISGYNPVLASDGVDGDNFGNSVSISGSFAIVGAYADDVNGKTNQGSAYIYSFNGTSWVQFQQIIAADGLAGDLFGSDVSIDGNFALVGAQSHDGSGTDAGAAYIFFYNGVEWVQSQKLTDATVTATDGFGTSVCIKGNLAIVGSLRDEVGLFTDAGSAYIYRNNGNTWVLERRVTASDPGTADHFGISVGIDSIYAIVGASDDDIDANANQGAAYLFFHNGTNWQQSGKFTRPIFAAASDNFGRSVAISGNYCVIGEPNYGASDAGAIHLLKLTSGVWAYSQEINIPATNAGNYTGRDVFISGDYFITGASGADVNGISSAGKVFIYKNFSGLWRLYEDFSDPAAGPVDALGSSVSISGNRFITGSGLPPNQNQRGLAIFGKVE